MSAQKVICPHCSRQLKTRKPLTEGHLVLCPRCGRSFRVPPQAILAQATQPAHQPATLARPEHDTAPSPALVTDTAPETPVPSFPPSGARTASATPTAGPGERSRLLALLILGGLAATMLLTFLLVLYFAARRPASATQAELPPAGPTDADVRAELSGDTSSSPPRPTVPPPVEEPWLPPEGQAEVDAAIERGVAFLKGNQDPFGSWGPRDPQHHVGLAALPGLTLLECGVAADDIRIEKAAEHIRKNAGNLNMTYDLALSILFLDRLGREEDRPLIRTLALRLVAGQLPSGGWSYGCPVLARQDEDNLERALALVRPGSSLDLFTQPGADPAELGSAQEKPGPQGTSAEGLPDPQAVQKARDALPPNLRQLASLQTTPPRRRLPVDHADNSNTQFAVLGLWAAGRQNLPLEPCLALIVRRFSQTQSKQGGWSYQTAGGPVTPPMTCTGLLGLAVGHGLRASATPVAPPQRIPQDPAIEKGFRFLAPHIGHADPWSPDRIKSRPQLNLYFMWSLERVGVLYNRRKIHTRDWYSWGAQRIVDAQQGNGSWRTGVYPGSIPITDTSFALLFLKRANLAKDLTKKLEFMFEGKRIE